MDLARNDINRVCDPLTCRVDRLMVVQKVRFRNIRVADVMDLTADERSFHMYNISCHRCPASYGQARRDSMRSVPFSPQGL